MKIGRREFVVLAGGTLVAAVAFAVRARFNQVQWHFLSLMGRVSDAEQQLHRHFGYLDVDLAGVRQYIKDFEARFGKLPAIDPWPDDVYTRFLMSTDFFEHDGDESQPVKYVGLYAPPFTPCSNPFFV